MRTLLLAGAALLALTTVSFAQEAICLPPDMSIAADKARSEVDGFSYLGLRTLPLTDNQAVFYTRDGVLYMSLQKDGCVAGVAHAIGYYVPGQSV